MPPAPRAGRTPLANFGTALVADRIGVAPAPSAEPPPTNFGAAVVPRRFRAASAPSAGPPLASFRGRDAGCPAPPAQIRT
ncbi:MAG: hypothetical protein OXH96_02965, partial [Spirochaetaceae bacterium]|nr:hypothetical protein [Spirochaetaceae bacterium]